MDVCYQVIILARVNMLYLCNVPKIDTSSFGILLLWKMPPYLSSGLKRPSFYIVLFKNSTSNTSQKHKVLECVTNFCSLLVRLMFISSRCWRLIFYDHAEWSWHSHEVTLSYSWSVRVSLTNSWLTKSYPFIPVSVSVIALIAAFTICSYVH